MEITSLFENVEYGSYLIFAFSILYLLFLNYFENEKTKIVACYFVMFLLGAFNILDKKLILFLFVITYFIYYEILINDEYKHKIINSVFSKIIDYIYTLCIYKFFFFIIILYFVSNYFINNYINWGLWNLTISLLLLIILSIRISIQPFETNSYTKMFSKLGNFGNYKESKFRHQKIVLDIEDRSFFYRQKSYTILSLGYIRYRIDRINDVLKIIEGRNNYKRDIRHLIRFIKYIFIQLRSVMHELNFTYIKRKIRGYSTIEMQLFKIIAIKSGFTKKKTRKLYEYIYTPLFFRGLKKYYKNNYEIVTDDYYKSFILTEYNKNVPMIMGNRYFENMKSFWGKDVSELTDEEYFLSILTFSGRINIYKLDFWGYKYIVKNFWDLDILKFLNKDAFEDAIHSMVDRYKFLTNETFGY